MSEVLYRPSHPLESAGFALVEAYCRANGNPNTSAAVRRTFAIEGLEGAVGKYLRICRYITHDASVQEVQAMEMNKPSLRELVQDMPTVGKAVGGLVEGTMVLLGGRTLLRTFDDILPIPVGWITGAWGSWI